MTLVSSIRIIPKRSAFAIPFFVISAVLLTRIFYGLDFTDEMQYYGQIRGLVEQGRLFSSDLFIQQIVYVIFYPLFKLHYLLFRESYLVIFGRVLLAALLYSVYFYSRKKFIENGAGSWQAGFAAASLTFCVPYHGIFALSYNTVSQFAWIIFMLWFWMWHLRPSWHWGLLIIFAGLAHPVAGVCMLGILAMRLMAERQFGYFLELMFYLVVLLFCVAGYLFAFASVDDLLTSFVFSKEFGVGAGLLASLGQLVFASLFLIALMLVGFMPTRLLWLLGNNYLLVLGLVAALGYLLRKTWLAGDTLTVGYFPNMVVVVATLMIIVYAHLLFHASAQERRLVRWGTLAFAGHFLTLVITSSNGLSQGVGAVFLAVPLLLGLLRWGASKNRTSGASSEYVSSAFGVTFLCFLIIHWSTFPYRDRHWFEANAIAHGIDAFRGIRISQAHAAFLEIYRASFLGRVEDKKIMLIGDFPVLYLALNAHPATCMLYVHSLPEQKAAKLVEECVQSKSPEVIMRITEQKNSPSYRQLKIDEYTLRLTEKLGLTNCSIKLVSLPAGVGATKIGVTQHISYCGRVN